MAQMIFLNLPVADLAKSTAFYEAIGAKKNAQFCDDTASCMVFSDTIHIMLLTHEKFKTFLPKPIVDARTASEMIICLSVESREAVDAMVDKAAEGGRADAWPEQNDDFMYGRNFEDPDGHVFEVMWMDVAAMMSAKAA